MSNIEVNLKKFTQRESEKLNTKCKTWQNLPTFMAKATGGDAWCVMFMQPFFPDHFSIAHLISEFGRKEIIVRVLKFYN